MRRNFVEIEELEYQPASEVNLDDLISLNTALGSLSSADNEIIYLKDFERYTYKEIALLLDISITNAKSRLFRAKKKLKKMLEDK
jgi:RNA polymerase sigma-70 factor (ECF subfamily)